MNSPLTLGQLIAEARKAKGLSQAALSKSCNYEYNVVNKWEHAQSKPTATDWQNLQELLAPELNLKQAAPLLAAGLGDGSGAGRPVAEVKASRIDPDFAGRLRALRERAGFEVKYVAQQLGMAPSQISRIETGHTVPSYAQLRKLTTLLGTTYDYLLDGVTPPAEPYVKVLAQRERLRAILDKMLDPDTAKELREEMETNPGARVAMGL